MMRFKWYLSIVTVFGFFWVLSVPQMARAQGGFPAEFDLNTLNGTNGFVIRGGNISERAGGFITGVGDVNGDGVDDFALGRNRRSPSPRADIFFGRTGGYPAIADLQRLIYPKNISRPQTGPGEPAGPLEPDVFVVDPTSGSAAAVTFIADLNDDGVSDLAVSQPFNSVESRVGIVYGTAPDANGSTLPAATDLSSLSDAEGFFIGGFGERGPMNFESDFDSGLFFIAIENGLNSVPIFYIDQATFSPGSPPPANFTNASMWGMAGNPGGRITGGDSTALFGASMDVSPGANSFAGNNSSALVIGAPADVRFTNTDQGHVYVIFNLETVLLPGMSFDASAINGTNGFVFEGAVAGDEAGFDVAFTPDLNGDGLDDLVIGIPGANDDTGEACVIYGSASPFPALLTPADLDGTNGLCFTGVAIGDRTGETVAGIADLDGSGTNEIVVGAPHADPGSLFDAGSAYIFQPGDFTAPAQNVTLVTPAGGTQTHIPGLNSADEFGTECDSPGDINGDGVADVMCSSPGASSFTGAVYAICGEAPEVAHTMDAVDDMLTTDEDTVLNANVFVDNGNGPDTDSLGHSFELQLANLISNQFIFGQTTSIFFQDPSPADPLDPDILPAGEVRFDANGDFTFSPNDAFQALGPSSPPITLIFNYTSTDNEGLNDTAQVTLTITGVNDPPASPAILTSISEPALGHAIVFAGFGSITDPEGIDDEVPFEFFWFADGVLLPQFTTSQIFLEDADLIGTTITAQVRFTDLGGTVETVSGGSVGPIRRPRLSVNVFGLGDGTISSNPAGISCDAGTVVGCEAEFDVDTVVGMGAIIAPGSRLVGFAGGSAGLCASSISDEITTCSALMDGDRIVRARFELLDPLPTVVVSAALPTARSGLAPVGAPEKSGFSGAATADGTAITVFYTAINAGAEPAQSCSIVIDAGLPVTLNYQATDATNTPVGTVDEPFDMNAGEIKTFVLSFIPVSVSTGIEVFPNVMCDNASVSPISGVNGVFLSISDTPSPDVLSIGATISGDGIIRIDTPGGAGFMSASALNIGVGDTGSPIDPVDPTANTAVMTVSADTGGTSLPLVMGVCALDAGGVCIAPPAPSVDIGVSFQAATMAVFVSATGEIALDPAVNRVFLRFVGADGITRSVTSVAISAP